MTKGAIVIGIVCILIGVWLTYKLLNSEEPFWLIIYLVILIGVGIGLIVFNKAEEKIEERKDLKSKKSK